MYVSMICLVCMSTYVMFLCLKPYEALSEVSKLLMGNRAPICQPWTIGSYFQIGDDLFDYLCVFLYVCR